MLFFGLAGILVIPLGFYLYFVVGRLFGLLFPAWGRRLKNTVSIVAAVALALPCVNLFGAWALVVLYFSAISICMDLLQLFIRRVLRRAQKKAASVNRLGTHKVWGILYRSGAAAAFFTAAVIGYAYWNMHHVVTTRYTVATEKNIRQEGYRIVFLSDLHFPTTMDREMLETYCKRMEAEKPDLVVLGGDIVDEATASEDVEAAFSALAQVHSTYGTYYVYGNHDKGRYARDCDFTPQGLEKMIQESGVKILEDETVQLDGPLYLSGRRDRSEAQAQQGRLSAETLVEAVPQDAFHILADHQPRGMEENAQAGFDLMLSGHTHAGQMWPVGLATTLFDKGTFNYGHKEYGAMDLIVSSGIAGWGYPLRTGKHSEIVVIEVQKE